MDIDRAQSIDLEFMEALRSFAGSGQELEFVRRGSGASTYMLHGVLESVDPVDWSMTILRTRSSVGEVRHMTAHLVLRFSAPDGRTFVNDIATARESAYEALQAQRRRERDTACDFFLANPYFDVGAAKLRSKLVASQGNRFVFCDLEVPSRRITISAKDVASATRFIAVQDYFMPLDDVLWFAIQARIQWPDGIADDCRVQANAWEIDWPAVLDSLRDVPPRALQHYIKRMSSDWDDFRNPGDLEPDAVQLLIDRGILVCEPPPSSPDELWARLSVANLRNLAREAGGRCASRTREALSAHLSASISPAIQASALSMMRAPLLLLRGPSGVSRQAFVSGLRQYRLHLFEMRQVLRGIQRD